MHLPSKKLQAFIETRTQDLVLGAIGLMAAIHIFNRLGLLADGSYYLLRMLAYKSVIFSDESRRLVVAMFQAPALLAVKAGLRNIDWLVNFYSFSLYAVPAAFWMTALVRLKREPCFWPFVVIYSVVYLNSGLCGVGEYNLAYAVAACSMAYLLSRRAIRRVDGLVLATTGFILLGAYEALVFLGPLLFAAAMLRLAKQEERGRWEWLWISCTGVCYLAATGIAAWFILNPRDPANRANAGSLAVLVKDRQIVVSMLVAFLYFAFWMSHREGTAAKRSARAALVLAWLLVVPLAWAGPVQHYLARSVAGGAMFLLFGVLVWVRFLGRVHETDAGVAAPGCGLGLARKIPLVMFTALLVPNLCLSFGFGAYVKRFRNEVDSRGGFIELKDTGFTKLDNALFGWGWTYPSMSLMLRRNETGGIILNPPLPAGRQRIFDPFDPRVTHFDLREYYGRS